MDFEAIFRFVVLALASGLGVVLAFLANRFNAYLVLKFTTEEISIAKETALMVVSTLKQSPAFEHIQPEKKKEIAMVWVSQKLESYGLEFSPEDVDRLIEEAVLVIKEAQ